MPFRHPPTVRPIDHYPKPRYPASGDLAAALKSRPEGPWPFLASPALVSAIIAASSGGCGTSAPPPVVAAQPAAAPTPSAPAPPPVATLAVEPEAPPPATEPTATPEPPVPAGPARLPDIGLQLRHSFSWEASHLPFVWTPYGTGAPARLSEDQMRPVIERVLRGAGIRPASNVTFARPGIAVQLDGYDSAKHIGWIFVDWQKLEDPFGLRGGMKKVDGKDGQDFSKMVSHAEIRGLMELDKQRQEHIIVISGQDPRFATSYGSKERFPEAPLRKLENNLRSYLGWLMSQGAL